MNRIHVCLLAIFCGTTVFAQLPVVNQPVIPVPSQSIYIDPNGNDANPGTQILPKKTFYSAMQAISFGIPNVNGGNNYGEIVLLPGDYYPGSNQGLVQTETQWRQNVSSTWVYRNVSVRGVGVVRVHGDSMGNSQQMIYLMGSGVSVRNLTIMDSKLHGVYFDGSEITHHHDVIVDSVTVDGAFGFGIYWSGYDRILAQNCVVNNTCRQNANEATCLWPSGLRADDCGHVTFRSNIVSRNWGEGLNCSYCRYVDVTDNVVFDNYSVNLYAHSVSKAMYRNNLVYNTDSTYWRYCYGANGTSAYGVSIANELSCTNGCAQFNNCGDNYSCCSSTDYDHPALTPVSYIQLDSVFIFNNVLFECGIHIWDAFSGFGNFAYMNHIYIEHNTIIGKPGDSLTTKAPIVITLNTGFIYFADIKLRNNILSQDLSLNNAYEFNAWAASNPCNAPWTNNFTSTGNLWQTLPVVPGVNFSGDAVSAPVIVHATAADTANITPSPNHPELIMNDPSISYITDDYFHNPRTGTTNAGAVEYDVNNGISSSNAQTISPSVFPNPAQDKFTLVIPQGSATWNSTILNSAGQVVSESNDLTSSTEISTVGWANGIYIARVSNGQENFNLKVVVCANGR